jgi:hypothetical protein
MKELREQFEGIGQVNGYSFQNKKKSPYSYLYAVKNNDTGTIHYEVFKRKENTLYNCVSYPTDKAFGIWAWTCSSLDRAVEKFDQLNLNIDLD